MRTDIYGLTPRQHDMFGEPQGSFDTPMTLAEIRRELESTLAELRAADAMPWPPRRVLETTNMFPVLAGELPPEEAARLGAAFDDQMRRLRGG